MSDTNIDGKEQVLMQVIEKALALLAGDDDPEFALIHALPKVEGEVNHIKVLSSMSASRLKKLMLDALLLDVAHAQESSICDCPKCAEAARENKQTH